MQILQTGFHHTACGEAIEAAALTSLHAQATPALRDKLGLVWRERAGARLSVAARLPATAIVINRAFGVRPDTLGSVAAEYRSMGIQRFFSAPRRSYGRPVGCGCGRRDGACEGLAEIRAPARCGAACE